jgi:hypothetical protein
MTPFLLAFFLIGVGITLFVDIPSSKNKTRAEKGMKYAIYGAAFALFVCYYMNITLPLPTRFFADKIADWFKLFVDNTRVNNI